MPYLSKIHQVKLGIETVYGDGGAGHAYFPVIERPDTAGLGRAFFEPDRVQAGLWQEPGVVGLADNVLGLKWHFHGRSATKPALSPDLALLTSYFDIGLLANAIGGCKIHRDGVPGAFTACSAIDVTKKILTVAAGLTYAPGEIIAIQTGGAGGAAPWKWETGVVATSGALEITLESPLQSANISVGVGADNLVYAGFTCFARNSWGGTFSPTFTAQLLGHPATDFLTATGLSTSAFKMSLAPRGFCTIDQSFTVDMATRAAAGGAPVFAALPYQERQQLAGGILRIETGDVVTLLDCSTCDFDLGLAIGQMLDVNPLSGKQRPVLTGRVPKFAVNPAYVNKTLFDAFAAQTQYDVQYVIGSQPGRMLVLQMSAGMLTADPELGDRDGVLAQPLTFVPCPYADVAPTTSEATPDNKILRVAVI